MHAGIAGRVFASIGPPAAPTRLIHGGLTRAIYGGVDRGIRGATQAAGAVAAELWGDDGDEALESRTTSAAVLAAVNGICGDELTERDNSLAGPMAIRHRGRVVPPTADGLATAFPSATERVVVFVHGWCLTERSWSRTPAKDTEEKDSRTYGERLREDLGFSPIRLRYNSARRIWVPIWRRA